MKAFEVTINGKKEVIHAKHIINGNFLVRPLKTGNFTGVKYIETLHGNNSEKVFRVKTFYPFSPHYGRENITQEVRLLG